MNHFDPQRLQRCFERTKAEGRAALVTFLTAGDPNPNVSETLLHQLPEAGADIIEIGMPFSDPMADGPIIQAASKRALQAGMNLSKTLDMAARFRQAFPETPIILMGYYNPIYRYGNDAFLAKIKQIGVDGLIVVDLPPEEDNELAIDAVAHQVHFIRLITPTSHDDRIRRILQNASGFIYYVSIKGITGTAQADTHAISSHLEKIRQQTDLPICVGFGINSPQRAQEVGRIADGVVVGSAIVESLVSGINKSQPQTGVDQAVDITRQLSAALQQQG